MASKNNHHKDLLISWLKNAYAMEQSLVPTMDHHAKYAQGIPEMRSRIQQHAEETRRHVELVRGCIERYGESPSAIKTGMSVIGSWAKNIAPGGPDELVKNTLADIAVERYEVACYRALIVAAQEVDDMHTVQICEVILHEEDEMAQFLEEHLDQLTRDVLHQYAAAHPS